MTKTESSIEKGYLHIVIVLDRSGSMYEVSDETISGFNEQVQTIKSNAKNSNRQVDVSLVLFNDHVKFPIKIAPAEKLKKIDREIYRPEGSTAMLDAVGSTILMFDKEVDDGDEHEYLVIIITDGMENSSREFTYEHISRMINKRQKTGRWTFSYIGANQDLFELHRKMGIPKGNIATYRSTSEGSITMFDNLERSMINFMTESDADSSSFISDNDNDDIEDFSN